MLQPAPSLQRQQKRGGTAAAGKGSTPFDRVWVGHTGIIGEVRVASVSVRIYKFYSDLGIDQPPEHKTYQCGRHDFAPLPQLARRMREVARKVGEINDKIPAHAKQRRIPLVIIRKYFKSAFRTADGQGLIMLDENAKGSWVDAAAHEGAHGLLMYHVASTSAGKRAPDPFSLRIADIYRRLEQTAEVPIPTAKFDPRNPPPVEGDGRKAQAGLVMVSDALWAGAGGHPWENMDEFFASAYAGFLQQPALLRRIIAYYGRKADPKIRQPARELLALLAQVGKARQLAALKAPQKGLDEARSLIRADVPEPPDLTGSTLDNIDELLDPSRLPGPSTISCGAAPPSGVKNRQFEDFYED